MQVKLFRCKICGDPYIGEKAPTRCPFCGSYQKFIEEPKKVKVTFDVKLDAKDKAFAEKALKFEISNAEFYACAADSTADDEGKLLFKALKKVETEHANIWKKILKLAKLEVGKSNKCSIEYKPNLQESHDRETKTIAFYKQAAEECKAARLKEIFNALVEVETDHLHLSEERLK